MYDNSGNNAFNDPALNASSKSIKSKVAASRDYFSGNTVLSFEIKAELGGVILQRWGFDQDLVEVARLAEAWHRYRVCAGGNLADQ